jgi:hypothetical protein
MGYYSDTARRVTAVNAYGDDDHIIVDCRIHPASLGVGDAEWQRIRLTRDDADQLQGMLYLLVKHGEG